MKDQAVKAEAYRALVIKQRDMYNKVLDYLQQKCNVCDGTGKILNEEKEKEECQFCSGMGVRGSFRIKDAKEFIMKKGCETALT